MPVPTQPQHRLADDLELAAQFIDDVVDAYLKSNDIDMGDHAEVTIEHWEKIRTSCSAAMNSEEKP